MVADIPVAGVQRGSIARSKHKPSGKLQMLDSAKDLNDLRAPPGNRLKEGRSRITHSGCDSASVTEVARGARVAVRRAVARVSLTIAAPLHRATPRMLPILDLQPGRLPAGARCWRTRRPRKRNLLGCPRYHDGQICSETKGLLLGLRSLRWPGHRSARCRGLHNQRRRMRPASPTSTGRSRTSTSIRPRSQVVRPIRPITTASSARCSSTWRVAFFLHLLPGSYLPPPSVT